MRDFRKKSKSRYYQVFGILLLCIAFISMVSNITLAWFRDESITSNGDANIILIGNVSLDVQTNFNFYNLALAPDKVYTTDFEGRPIGTYIKTSNTHTTEGAYVRIKYETSRTNVGDTDARDNKDLLNLYFNGNTTTSSTYTTDSNGNSQEKNKWYYNSADGYWYYIGAIEDDWICFNVGYVTSNYMTNVERNAPVTITLYVESVQRQYGAYDKVWSNPPTIFSGWATADEGVRWGKQ